MRRYLALTLAVLCVSAVSASAGSIGLGAFGGMSYSVMQNDVGNGTLYGLRAPVKLIPFVAVEPWYTSTALGDKVQSVAGVNLTHAGFDQTSYGANVLLATGGPLSFYPFAGIGSTTFKRGGANETYTSYSAGFGLSVSPVPKLSLDIRGELEAVMDNGTTRKFGNATVGLGYSLFSIP